MAGHAKKFRTHVSQGDGKNEISERQIIFPRINERLKEEDEKYMPFSSSISEELFHRIEEGMIKAKSFYSAPPLIKIRVRDQHLADREAENFDSY
ncbi:hypothetical protein E2K80_06110 [Rhodophyticola sp. CCM32]|uniref:hypothetical protein n=1 Tax=Rhodophyticola sp. CCM32 TaxID=2916397 RepID=UPI00107FADE2|nr:hypothetical protein [Rhodophyticola sp. CCM32]QBY00366.1 hypothetical protein E2K80_06110 [Rhodophyticola sp. CCM32]